MIGFVEKHPLLNEVKGHYGAIQPDARAYWLFASREGGPRSD